MSIRTAVIVASSVVAAYLGLLQLEMAYDPVWTYRWLSDDDDRRVYYAIAQYYPQGRVPYRDVDSVYPTLATLLFAVPFLTPGGSAISLATYSFRWSFLMAPVLVATIALVASVRRGHGLRAGPALLLLLPSALYFSLMRFDIACTLLVCASLAAFSRERYVLAHVVLGLATFVKWYPAVVFPVYVAYHLWREPAVSLHPLALLRTNAVRYGAWYLLTILAIIAISVAAFTWEGFLVPYRFHGARGADFFNPYYLLEVYRAPLGLGDSAWPWVNRGFLALQVSIVPILLFKRVRSLTDVFRYAVLAIYLFITFARVDSPQWILWYLPPVLMFVRDVRTLIVVIVLAVLNYVVFPVAYDHLPGTPFSAIVFVKDLVVLALIVMVFRDRGPEPWQARDLAHDRRVASAT